MSAKHQIVPPKSQTHYFVMGSKYVSVRAPSKEDALAFLSKTNLPDDKLKHIGSDRGGLPLGCAPLFERKNPHFVHPRSYLVRVEYVVLKKPRNCFSCGKKIQALTKTPVTIVSVKANGLERSALVRRWTCSNCHSKDFYSAVQQ